MAEFSIKVNGLEILLKNIEDYTKEKQKQVEGALWSVAGKVTLQAKDNCRSLLGWRENGEYVKPTGRLGGSITMASTWGKKTSPTSPAKSEDAIGSPAGIQEKAVVVGTNLVYARRVEFGFVGKDKLGRRYNQAARPYLYPAFFAHINDLIPLLKKAFANVEGVTFKEE